MFRTACSIADGYTFMPRTTTMSSVRPAMPPGSHGLTFYTERGAMDEVALARGGTARAPGRDAPAARPARERGAVSAAPRRTSRIRGASEQVASEILHHIQREGLGPGDFLGREEDLAADFGVSRPTLREALKLLASGNLICASKGPGGGIFVALTADQGMSRSLSDAIAMMLETRARCRSPSCSRRGCCSRCRWPVRPRIAPTPATGGNRMVQAFTDWVFEVLQPSLMAVIGHAVLGSAIAEHHEALVNAIEKGDAPRAERAMKEHLLYLGDVLRMVET